MRFAMLAGLLAVTATAIQGQAISQTVADSTGQSSERPYRDPHTAVVMGSIIPGAGYMYAGEYLRGYLAAIGTVGDIAIGSLIYDMDGCSLAILSFDCHPGPRWPYRVAGILTVSAGLYTWISSARNSRRAAERANAKHAASARRLDPILERGSNDDWRAGLALRW